MEFLKDTFGSEALTYEQFAEKLKDSKEIKLGNLAGGQYVQREKLTTVEAERDGLRSQLSEANDTIKNFEGLDVEGIKAKSTEWETKYKTDTEALQAKLDAANYSFALDKALGGIKFSSESARKAFVADLTEKKLPVQDGALLGLTDFVSKYREGDPNAFAPDSVPPKIILGGGKKSPLTEVTREAYQKMGYADRLKLKTEQPELYKELSAQ